ncbi:MAG: hypothetical protein WB608_10100 [Terracidiphilus sp.]
MRKSRNFLSQTMDKPAPFCVLFPTNAGIGARADWPDREERDGEVRKKRMYPHTSAVGIDASFSGSEFHGKREKQSSSAIKGWIGLMKRNNPIESQLDGEAAERKYEHKAAQHLKRKVT